MQWRLRPALREDLRGLVAMERAMPDLPHWSEGEYEGYLASEAGRERLLLVAVDARTGALLGFAAAVAMRLGAEAPAELESLAVVPGARRGGLGRLLCLRVMKWCRECGARALELEVRSASGGAIELYRSLGFHSVGRRSRYYADPPDDAVLMSCVL